MTSSTTTAAKTKPKAKTKRAIGVAGVLIGFLALTTAFLSPWIMDLIDPPAKPLEEVAVDFAGRLAEAAKAKVTGKQYIPKAATVPLPSRFFVPTVIAMGMLGMGLGVLSLLCSEPRAVGGGAVALGISAVVVQWSIVIAGAILVLLLALLVLGGLGFI